MTRQVGRAYAVETSEKAPTATFMAATWDLARDGLVVERGALDYRAYLKNPVVLASHSYDSLEAVIGRTTALRETDQGLIATFEFDTESEGGALALSKIRRGFLNAASIGWNTTRQEGNRVKAGELLDISIVGVPGDSNALAIARSAYQRSLAEPTADSTLKKLHALIVEQPRRQGDAKNFLDPATWKRLTPDEQERVLREIRRRLDLIGIRNELVRQQIPGLVRKELAERIPAK